MSWGTELPTGKVNEVLGQIYPFQEVPLGSMNQPRLGACTSQFMKQVKKSGPLNHSKQDGQCSQIHPQDELSQPGRKQLYYNSGLQEVGSWRLESRGDWQGRWVILQYLASFYPENSRKSLKGLTVKCLEIMFFFFQLGIWDTLECDNIDKNSMEPC